MPIADSQGTTFSFNGVDFTARNVKVKRTAPPIDVTSLAETSGQMRVYQPAVLRDGDMITCEYWGTTAPSQGDSGTITCATLGISGDAFCEDFELTAAVGELIVGTASFRLTGVAA